MATEVIVSLRRSEDESSKRDGKSRLQGKSCHHQQIWINVILFVYMWRKILETGCGLVSLSLKSFLREGWPTGLGRKDVIAIPRLVMAKSEQSQQTEDQTTHTHTYPVLPCLQRARTCMFLGLGPSKNLQDVQNPWKINHKGTIETDTNLLTLSGTTTSAGT